MASDERERIKQMEEKMRLQKEKEERERREAEQLEKIRAEFVLSKSRTWPLPSLFPIPNRVRLRGEIGCFQGITCSQKINRTAGDGEFQEKLLEKSQFMLLSVLFLARSKFVVYKFSSKRCYYEGKTFKNISRKAVCSLLG